MDIYSKKLPSIKQLQYFIAVCEEHSFRGAANKLNVSQPPLSIQIKELEEKLEVSLFLRNSHQVVLTKEGEEFKSKVTQILKELCSVTKSIKSNNGNKITLGTTKTLSFDFIDYFKEFFTEFADVIEIYKHNYTSKELQFELQKRHIDFAFVSDYQSRNEHENSLLIYREPMMLVLPDSHRSSKCNQIDLNEMLDLPLFWFKQHSNPSFYEQCEQVFKTLNRPVARRPELPDNLSMLLEVSLGKAMMLLPQSMVQAKLDGVVYKPLINKQSEKLKIDIYLIWRRDLHKTPLSEAIIDYFKGKCFTLEK
ncbi:LysR family transcriptional regulator [Gilliamella sp. wkB112]|uniref:LysR family transcriptional regulator n=1 Tax=Gilliamella sp. wkB112 TaxID=3120257 RepID=UPI00080DC19F|nr:LysR family transcriptional regulator [Gilliamella apicola]OCG02886.1 hypothetical protein A9G12_08115 [Gilliamella apicola]